MSIYSISRESGNAADTVNVATTDDYTTISTSGYILEQQDEINALNDGEFTWRPTDTVKVSYVDTSGDNQTAFFTYDASTGSLISDTPEGLGTMAYQNANNVNITGGVITADDDITSLEGNLIAGSDGNAGTITSFPSSTASGRLVMEAADNDGNFTVTIENTAHGQDTRIAIPDVQQSAGSFLVCRLDNSSPAANLVTFNIPVSFTQLAGSGVVGLYPSNTGESFRIRELYLSPYDTPEDFSGGDRLATISDGSTAYSIIPAEDLQDLSNARWGSTALPFPVSQPLSEQTIPGANLTIAYSGGTSDYTAGIMLISGMLERIF